MVLSPLIIGHRGASAVAPENTLAAFSRAMQDGADGIEFDVRLSSDGVPVVIHDETLKRTGSIARLVSELTVKELCDADVGSWFAAPSPRHAQPFASEKLPTLTQVFDLFSANNGLLYAEMKCAPGEADALAVAVVATMEEFRIGPRVVVASFDLSAIDQVKRIDPEIRTAALFEPKLSKPFSSVRRQKMIDATLAVAANEIALHHTLASTRVIERAKQEGLEIVVWTVDDPVWITRARELGIKALIANDPGFMVKRRNSTTSEFHF